MGQSTGRPASGRQMPQHAPQKVARKLQKNHGPDAHSKLPQGLFRNLNFYLRILLFFSDTETTMFVASSQVESNTRFFAFGTRIYPTTKCIKTK